MTASSYQIKTMTRAQVDLAADWAAREGWNPGLNDAACYLAADPLGFYLGFLDGQPISSISMVTYGKGFAFLGFYIVVPEFRGKGYGFALWQHAMSAASGRNIGLDGVVAQQENYKKSGFRLAFRNIRYEGVALEPVPDQPDILPLDQVSPSDFLAFDRPFFPEDRTRFIQAWISQPGASALGFCLRGKLEGYGVIRPCRTGAKIGPLFARTPAQAEALFIALAGRAPRGTPVFLDVPEPNAAATDLAERFGMTPCFETARMYTGPFPDLPMTAIFGMTSFEVG